MTDGAPEGALAGLRVIDLSRVLGGPYCTQILGDHGADVIKVESPVGDETRTWGPPFRDGVAAYYLAANRNKRSVILDLGTPLGREALMGLLEGADVVIDNFKAGTLEAWGLGYEAVLKPRFPRLIHCAVTGFGPDGPLGALPGYDAAVQAMSGLMSVNGSADGPPTRVGVPIVDMVTGLNATIAILLALQERERSGLGQSLDIALYDCALSVLHPHPTNLFYSGKVPGRSGNAHPNVAPYDTFATASDPIFLAVGNNQQFQKLCAHLGASELGEDPRYATNALRGQNRDGLKAALERLMASHDGAALADALIRAGVPCAPVLTVDAVVAHPHTRHRGMVVEMGEDYIGVGAPVKLSRTPATYRRPPPRLGEHTEEVLGKLGKKD